MIMKSIKNQMFLLLFLSSTAFVSPAVAADKPVWTIDYEKLNLPERGNPFGRAKPDPNFRVEFTLDNKILISFLQHKPQTKGSKDTPEKFVVLLLSRETGELIKGVELPLVSEVPGMYHRIYPLPSGGYVGIINLLLPNVFLHNLFVVSLPIT